MIRDVPRDQWLYNDRGMVKWLGYFLSDHTQDMADKKVDEVSTHRLPEQDPEVIDRVLQDSWQNSKQITLQLNDDGYLNVYNISGIVIGTNGDLIYLQTDKLVTINVNDIRHAKLKEGSKSI
ncbi:hypothetical protein [Lentilactobacillus buchneri]|uniref:hypothetical protein n=1 Tax=Lentilactobacillus buchneri TaxID=1581 RepID=UPI0002075EF5|nr:hypothetical protein [Lentilactobacillus buchneri]AEB73081.1 hypothetical protein Lbuc_0819 [Lentilactobacillus buchneri NRRL B-30929]MQM82286.1 hypothetical protein [Lentilactobacillus buchneri]